MTYSTDLREKVMEFLQKGCRMGQAADAFGVSEFTVNKWKRLLERTGSLEESGFFEAWFEGGGCCRPCQRTR